MSAFASHAGLMGCFRNNYVYVGLAPHTLHSNANWGGQRSCWESVS